MLLQVTPIVAVAPLIIICVKDPTASMVICAALVALFPIISNTTLGLRSVEPDLQSYFQLNRATRLQTLLRLRIPAHCPTFWRAAYLQRAGSSGCGGRVCYGTGARVLAWRTRSCKRAFSPTSRACLLRC